MPVPLPRKDPDISALISKVIEKYPNSLPALVKDISKGDISNQMNAFGAVSSLLPMQMGMVMNPKNVGILQSALKGQGVERAINYLKLKYPRLTKIPAQFRSSELSPVTGFYDVPTKSAVIGQVDRTLPEMVQTGGHELTHAYRDRGDWIKQLLEFNGPIDVEEALARQGGATAKKTYEKFLSLIK